MSPTFATRVCTALLMLALAACAGGTKLVNSWKAPDAAPITVKQGDLVIAMVMSKEETTRRTGEDLLGEELRQRGLRPIPSFTLIPTDQVDDREKAALAYAEAIAWHQPSDDALWDRLHQHFTEPELVELGCFIALTFGQQSWLRLLNIEHHQVLPGTAASMAPGFETAEALAESKQATDYWARR